MSEIETTERSNAELAERVRAAHKAVQETRLTALAGVLVAGAALDELRKRVQPGWQRFVVEHCRIPLSTAKLYLQIIDHRAEVEAKIRADPNFSLRAARRLIAKPKTVTTAKKKTSRPLPTLQDLWNAAVPSERAAVLARMALSDLLATLPPALRKQFYAASKAAPGEGEPEGEPFLTASEALRRAISLLKNPSVPNNNEALAALRAIGRMLGDIGIDDITIIKQHAKERRRAA
jgi:hypothetical protein